MTVPATTAAVKGPADTAAPQAAATETAAGKNSSPIDTPASSAAEAVHANKAAPALANESPTPEMAQPAARSERTRDISFDDLKFDIQKGDSFKRSLLTEKIESLEGKPIRIRGYILPSFLQSGLTQFVLVRDNQSCCFGPGAALYDCVIVEMKPGKSTDYSLYPVAVDGTFSIREMADPDGKTVAVYHLDGESVR